MYSSPLRYPGGKALMTKFFVNLFRENGLRDIVYAEPYAGGAGAAINLLIQNVVDDIIINDANIGIFSFWHSLVNDSEHFIQAINDTPVTITEWHRQRAIFKTSVEPSFDLGVATFFLSRTNRSGVITGGAIGGTTEEKQKAAKYKIDCRFNKKELLQRLQAISEQREHIRVNNMDALDFLRTLDNNVFVYLDPPYYAKGKCLYMNHYTDDNHAQLANFLQQEAGFRWVLSYDDVPQIRGLYTTQNLYRFPLKYTVEMKRTGYELLTHSLNLRFPQNMQIKRNKGKAIDIERIK
jgi:DNA adenine methylase